EWKTNQSCRRARFAKVPSGQYRGSKFGCRPQLVGASLNLRCPKKTADDRRSRLSSAVLISGYWNEPQRLLTEPAGTVGSPPVRSPALPAGFASGAALVSWLASGLL